ncbi:metabolite transport protein YwtG [Apiospora kogelbergensis]|uniref:metabolite transport protein YwtG n=1 Tax=Apiospora kogelbergensis TaxID=1337665 RepID=UPI003131F59B
MAEKPERIATTDIPSKGVSDTHVEDSAHPVVDDAVNTNLEAKIKNPLKGVPYHQLMSDVDAFAQEKGLTEHVELLRKGALVAQNPSNFGEELTGQHALDEAEIKALREEVTHKWRLPAKLYLTIATCSIGAAVQGWDQTGSNGATIWFPGYYGIEENELLVGMINAGPYIGCALLGCWLSDPANNYLGRRGVIFLSGHLCLWPVIGSAFCDTWKQQFACRLLMGVGMGIKASTVPIYAAENSPASIRGALVMSWQMWTAFGIMLGTAVNLACFYHVHNWRLMLGKRPFIPAVPLVFLIYLCPESPRWLMKKNRYPKAWVNMIKLRNHPIQVARDLYYIHAQLSIEQQITKKSNYLTRAGQLFTIPRVRRANIAAFTVMLAQQMCGINIIAFYSTTVFKAAGSTEFIAMVSSFGFGMVNFLFAFPAFWTIDTFGRRSLLLFTFPNMMWSLLAAGLCTLMPNSPARTALVALFVYVFAAFYSPGEGPVPFTYSAEVYPLSHREVGMGFAVATCLGFAAVLGITFPLILTSLGTAGAFGLYAGFNFAAFWLIFFLVPETKQRTLEELDYVFGVPMGKFATYQVTKATPWWFKRYVFFQKHAVLEPLYHVDNDAHDDSDRAEHHPMRSSPTGTDIEKSARPVPDFEGDKKM